MRKLILAFLVFLVMVCACSSPDYGETVLKERVGPWLVTLTQRVSLDYPNYWVASSVLIYRGYLDPPYSTPGYHSQRVATCDEIPEALLQQKNKLEPIFYETVEGLRDFHDCREDL